MPYQPDPGMLTALRRVCPHTADELATWDFSGVPSDIRTSDLRIYDCNGTEVVPGDDETLSDAAVRVARASLPNALKLSTCPKEFRIHSHHGAMVLWRDITLEVLAMARWAEDHPQQDLPMDRPMMLLDIVCDNVIARGSGEAGMDGWSYDMDWRVHHGEPPPRTPDKVPDWFQDGQGGTE